MKDDYRVHRYVAPLGRIEKMMKNIVMPAELADKILELIAASRAGGLSDEQIAARLQDAVDALIEGMS